MYMRKSERSARTLTLASLGAGVVTSVNNSRSLSLRYHIKCASAVSEVPIKSKVTNLINVSASEEI